MIKNRAHLCGMIGLGFETQAEVAVTFATREGIAANSV